MKNLDEKTKTKLLKLIKEEYKKHYVGNDENLENDFKDIHSLGDGELSVNKIQIIQTIMELFGADVNAYHKFIDETFIESDE